MDSYISLSTVDAAMDSSSSHPRLSPATRPASLSHSSSPSSFSPDFLPPSSPTSSFLSLFTPCLSPFPPRRTCSSPTSTFLSSTPSPPRRTCSSPTSPTSSFLSSSPSPPRRTCVSPSSPTSSFPPSLSLSPSPLHLTYLAPSSPPSSLSHSSFSSSSLSPSPLLPSFSPPSSPPSYLSPSSLPPSSSSHTWTHQVFPSFRGEDVRKEFLSHFRKEFTRKGITLFNDNGIKRGESIGPELISAIRGSKIAIIFLSRNYASSKWCLDELAEIMKCREELGQTVMTIFYKVDPSEVRKLSGDFGKVFRETCAGKSKEDIERWSQALVDVAKIAGYDSKNWHNEAAMIEEIANDVSSVLLNYAPQIDFNKFIGMRDHMGQIELLLGLSSNEVRMIGIWGPSGIGKSTIARVLFSKHSHKFPFSVYMENIKGRYPRPCFDEYSAKLQLQNEFLSQIINKEDIKVNHLGGAKNMLKDKRVLVVLDDVDKSSQLDAMAKETKWFGPGSRIIITTEDKKILNAHGVDHIYKVRFPSDDKALQIFCMYAFGQKSPCDGFMNLACEVIKLAGNLPLGLRVMGSYFKGMLKHEWERELPRLRASLDGEIESILKFSYDALRDEDKKLFLYIACFFNDELIEKVEEHLANKLPHVRRGIQVLEEKSLISTTVMWHSSIVIRMHSLQAQLGREIVRKQSIDNPGKRQFLVEPRDICQVLDNDTLDSNSVICINSKHYEIEDELYRSERAFEKMYNLEFLRLYDGVYDRSGLYLPKNQNNLPRKIRLLHWECFPMACLPSNFNPEFLVELNMPYSKLEKLWEGIKMIRNLKWVNLKSSRNLKELPDLSTATNLEKLNVSDCSSLLELPSSVGNAINLIELDASECSNLVELPSSLGNAINLRQLDLRYCLNLVKLPSSLGNATNLEKLDLNNCIHLIEIPSTLGNASSIRKLRFMHCESLVEIPFSIINAAALDKNTFSGCSRLVEIPSFIGDAIHLRIFDLNGCSSLVKLPSSIDILTKLRKLYLNECSSLVELPRSIGNLTKLTHLYLNGCSSLVKLPFSIGNLSRLRTLDLSGCLCLMKLPSSIGKLTYLYELHLQSCSSLVKLPFSIGKATNLKGLDLSDCSSLVKLPSSLKNVNLEILILSGCLSLVEFPFSVGYTTKLKILKFMNCPRLVKLPLFMSYSVDISGCSMLVEFSSFVGNAADVKELNLTGCSSLVELPSSIGNDINLQQLYLSGCTSLVKLPSFTGNAIHLEQLNLSDCSSLLELPSSIGNAIKLQRLNLSGCTSLVELPSSIGNATSLVNLDLSRCVRLKELPSSIGNAINLENLNLSGCSSLLTLPSSIGNLDHLLILSLRDCSNLEALPVNINMKSLYELDLTNCSSLKSFPEISTNITNLGLTRTAIEEVPSSIMSWSRLDVFQISYWENLGDFRHAFDCITKLHLSGTRTTGIAPWVNELPRLQKLEIMGCRRLVSIPKLPDSLTILDARNCESLERLHCSFHNTEFTALNFVNCFKLNQKARDLIIKRSTCERLLPGEKVPAYFTYRATGSFLTMKWNGMDTHAPISLGFKACVLLVNKSDADVGGGKIWGISYCIKEKQNGIIVTRGSIKYHYLSPLLDEHLYIFDVVEKVSSSELEFEFEVHDKNWEIGECGIYLIPPFWVFLNLEKP